MVLTKSFMYVVKCSDNTLYAGYTTNILRRLEVHNAKKGAKYTKSRLPVILKYL
ncbi:GIY-YIG nuclease super domain protein [Gemella bergeri ATCC 700627]|uniref:GIY-YIG nuclease super domain protein n=1 Tax=Gemella bergeri ATCC 700627 TaxID=1321820 RepID=U2QVV7_9BACL|nr:GIY-YIG nuclease super domain protein [Gemella bergeri ATCC 700627]